MHSAADGACILLWLGSEAVLSGADGPQTHLHPRVRETSRAGPHRMHGAGDGECAALRATPTARGQFVAADLYATSPGAVPGNTVPLRSVGMRRSSLSVTCGARRSSSNSAFQQLRPDARRPVPHAHRRCGCTGCCRECGRTLRHHRRLRCRSRSRSRNDSRRADPGARGCRHV